MYGLCGEGCGREGGFIFACLANLALECADFSEAIFSNVSLVL